MAVWPSAAVEKVCDFLVGIVVLRAVSLVMIPPRFSILRERSDVEQKNVTDASRQDSALDGHTKSNASSGSTPLLGSRSKTFLTVLTTHEKYHQHLTWLQPSIVGGFLTGINGALNEGLELRMKELEVDVLGTKSIRANDSSPYWDFNECRRNTQEC